MKNAEGFYLKINEIIDACSGIVKKDRSYSLPNGRRNFGFIYFLSGQTTYTFNNCVYTVGEGDMIFLKESSMPYRISSRKGTENLALNFTIHKKASFGEVLDELTCACQQEKNTQIPQDYGKCNQCHQQKQLRCAHDCNECCI